MHSHLSWWRSRQNADTLVSAHYEPLHDGLVTTKLYRGTSPNANVTLMQTAIPPDLLAELKRQKLIGQEASAPS